MDVILTAFGHFIEFFVALYEDAIITATCNSVWYNWIYSKQLLKGDEVSKISNAFEILDAIEELKEELDEL